MLEIGNRALEIMEARLGHGDLSVGSILVQLGRVHVRQKDFIKAEEYFQRAMQIVVAKLGPDHPHTADHVSTLLPQFISFFIYIYNVNFD